MNEERINSNETFDDFMDTNSKKKSVHDDGYNNDTLFHMHALT